MPKCSYVCACVALLLACAATCCATPVYEPVPGGTEWFAIEVYDPVAGEEYGKARIEYAYWQSGDYWHYAYKIFDNDYFCTPEDPTDDYHFGWLYVPGYYEDPSVYETIHKFSIDLDPDDKGYGPSDLAVLDTSGGSTAGGDAWGNSLDPNNMGVDWTVSLGSGTPLPIAPARGRPGGKKELPWVFTDGDSSRDDATGHYFQIASARAPAPCTAAISAGVDKQADGIVMGPVAGQVVPEPCSLSVLILGAGTVLFARRRPKP